MEEITLEEAFENITNERSERCKKHNLVDILMIVFLGILCGYKSIAQIHFYASLSEGITSAAENKPCFEQKKEWKKLATFGMP